MEALVRLIVIFLLAASIFAAPSILDVTSDEPSPLAGALATESVRPVKPTVELASLRREATISNQMANSDGSMGMMIMGGVVTLVMMLSTGGSLAISVAFDRWNARSR
jgi:hypothetical protein